MLRRHPTSIAITTNDLAIFEKVYAQRGLYTTDNHHHHHQESSINGNDGYGEEDPIEISGVTGWAGRVARSEAGQGEEARDGADREERRVKSTQERIEGIAAAAAAAAGAGAGNAGAGNAGAGGAGGNGSGSGGGGGRAVGPTQHRR